MFEDLGEVIGTTAVTLVVSALAVLMHWMVLARLGARHHRREMTHAPVGARAQLWTFAALFAAHLAEIALYGVAFWFNMQVLGAGSIADASDTSLLDSMYLSSVTFTTAGYGDVSPRGAIRLIAGTESLVGLMLITWSASFAFLVMQCQWRSPSADDRPDLPDDPRA